MDGTPRSHSLPTPVFAPLSVSTAESVPSSLSPSLLFWLPACPSSPQPRQQARHCSLPSHLPYTTASQRQLISAKRTMLIGQGQTRAGSLVLIKRSGDPPSPSPPAQKQARKQASRGWRWRRSAYFSSRKRSPTSLGVGLGRCNAILCQLSSLSSPASRALLHNWSSGFGLIAVSLKITVSERP